MTASTWVKHELGSVANFLGGATPSTSRAEYWNGDVQWTTSKRLGASVRISVGEKQITRAGLENSSTSLVPKGNVLVATRVGVGKVAVNTVDMAISQDLTGLIVDRERFNSFFLAYCLTQPRIQEVFGLQARGTTIKGIPRDDLEKITFEAPDRTEQEQIAAVLWLVQKAVDAQDKLVRTTRELKTAAMQRLFTRGLRDEPLRESEIGPVPDSWNVKTGSQLFRLTSGDPRPQDLAKLPDEIKRFPVYGGNGVMGYSAHWHLDVEGCVVIGRVGEYCGATHLAAGKVWITDNALYVKEWVAENALPAFVAYYLQYYDLNRYKRMAGQPLVTQGVIYELHFAFPKVDEQRDIAHVLQTLDRKIVLHEKKRSALQDLFQTLLHQLMTARIRVNDLDIDTSEVTG